MNIKYRPEIDGLRAIAVLPVILFHAGVKPFGGGFVGVDIFFVISGFLITSIIVADLKDGTFSFGAFYERRARRILPALLVMVACCIPFAWMWMLPKEMKAFAASVVDVNLFATNILFWQESGYFDRASELKPLLHTWSLALEEQYYLLFPMLAVFLWRLGEKGMIAAIAMLAIGSLALSQYAAVSAPAFGFYWLPTRAWELLAGSLASFIILENAPTRDNVLSIAGLAAIVFSVFWFNKTTPSPSFYSLLPVGGAALILIFGKSGTQVQKILSLRPLVGVGLVSYSAYLWHQPLLAFARIRLMGDLSEVAILALVLLAFLLATLSWRFVELPMRTKKLPVMRRKVVAISVAALFCISLSAFGIAGQLTNGYPERLTAAAKSFLAPPPQIADCSLPNVASEKSCTYGNRSNVVIALIGDSHADALASELGQELARNGEGLRALTYAGCPPITSYKMQYGTVLRDCAAYNKSVVDFLVHHTEIKTVILFARWTRYIEFVPFDNGEGGHEFGDPFSALIDGISEPDSKETQKQIGILYQQSVHQLLNMGENVILIYPQPEVGWDAPSLLAEASLLGIEVPRPLTTSYQRFKDRSKLAYDSLDAIGEDHRLVRIKPETIFCNTFAQQRCAADDGKELFYSDDNHPNAYGASLIAQEVGFAMKANGL